MGQVSRLRAGHLQQGSRDQPQRLPEVRAPLPHQRDRAAADAVRRRRGPSTTRTWSRPTRSASPTPSRTRRGSRPSIESTGLKDAVIVGVRRHRRHPHRRRVDGVRLHRRQHGRRRRREDHARHRARDRRRGMPVVIVCCSGGARMMEGALSLMQMAKICGALARLDRARLPFISVLTDPTTGGVTASFAMLGDLNIAEPKALIGFAGPRVIEQTIRQKLPEGFQRSEFLLEKGMLDLVVDRREMKAMIANALRFMGAQRSRRSPVAGRRSSAAARQPQPPAPQSQLAHSSHQPSSHQPSPVDPLHLAVRPRAVRHQVRPRQHLRDRRAARPSRARVPIGAHRRHQRQGLGDGDGRRRRCAPPAIARRATPRRISSISRSASSSTAGRSRGDALAAAVADVRDAIDEPARATAGSRCSRRSSRSRRRSRSSCSGAPESRSRCSRSDSAAGSTPPTSSRRRASSPPRSPRSPSITSCISGRRCAEIALEKAGIIKPGVPVVVGPLDPEAAAAIDEVGARARRAGHPRRARAIATDSTVGLRGRPSALERGGRGAAARARSTRAASRVPRAGDRGRPRASASGRAGSRCAGFADGRELLLDAAHNPAGAAALASYLKAERRRATAARVRRHARQGRRRACSRRCCRPSAV